MSNLIRNIKKGFTLIELLVVIAIIAILAAILVPAVNKALVEGRLTTLINNGRNIYISLKADELSNVLGGRRTWPESPGPNAHNFPNSNAFFVWMVTNGVLSVDYSFFGAPGHQSEATTDVNRFLAVNDVNAWVITMNAAGMRDTAPILFTSNVRVENSSTRLTTANQRPWLDPQSSPFGDRGGAYVLMGGAAAKLTKGFTTNTFNAAGANNPVLYPLTSR